jgi:hypothetical protein
VIQTDALRDRSDFAVLSVSFDEEKTLPALRKLIRKHHITFPVLYFGNQDAHWGSHDWNIEAVPEAYLIDPQGNIVLVTWVNENFTQMMQYFLDQPSIPLYGMEWSHSTLPDGSYKLDLHVTSSTHQPLPVKIKVEKCVKEYVEEHDGQYVPIDPIPAGKEWNCSSYYTLEGFGDLLRTATFGEFGDTTISITVPRVEHAWQLSYDATFIMPGTEQLLDGDGITVETYGNFDIEDPPQPEAK